MSALRPRRAQLLIVVGALLLQSPARAQAVRVYELELPPLAPGGQGGVLLNGGALLPHGQLLAALFTAYDFGPLFYRLNGAREVAPVVDRFSAHLVLAFAAQSWLQLWAQLPLVVNQQGMNLSDAGVAKAWTIGLGPTTAGVRLGVASQARAQPVDVAVDLFVRLPGYPSGGPGHELPVAGGLRAAVARSFGNLRLELAAGGLVEPASSGAGLGGWLEAGAAAVYMRAGVGQELDVLAHWPLSGGPASVEVLSGIRFRLGDTPFEVYLLAGPGFGEPPTFTFRFLGGLAFGLPVADVRVRALSAGPGLPPPRLTPNPARQDSDGDGLPDASDACPLEAGAAELGGCADHDSDGDALLDSVDRCPNTAGPPERLGCPPPLP